jgi:hypothetical protein
MLSARKAAIASERVRKGRRRETMKTWLFRWCVAVLAPACGAHSAHGIVPGIEDPDEFTIPDSPYYGMNWDYVYRSGGGSSVAIGYFRLLTAEHYGLDLHETFTIDGDEFEVVDVSYLPTDPGQPARPDMRILELRNNTDPLRPLPGFYSLYTGQFSTEEEMVLVGWGVTGEGRPRYYVEDPNSPRLKRWGTNVYDEPDSPPVGPKYSTQCFRMDFIASGSPHEVGYGKGDSGGGAFVLHDGVWKLAGMNLYNDTGIGNMHRFLFAASIPHYAERIYEELRDDRLPGDVDVDGDVDAFDYIAAKRWVARSGGASLLEEDTSGDLDDVPVSDGLGPLSEIRALLLAVRTNFGYVSTPHPNAQPMTPFGVGGTSQPVPEPTGVGLLAAGAVVLLRRRARRRLGRPRRAR